MGKTACGVEIIQIVDALPYEELIWTKDVAGRLADHLLIFYDKVRAAVNMMNEPRFSNYFFEKRGSSFVQSVAISGFRGFRSIDHLF